MVDSLRTLGIVAHIDAGKTTLTERILFETGSRRFPGEVDEGTAAMDWMRLEQERGISIAAASTRVSWHGARLQIVDTPGHVDFTAEVARCLRILDSVVVVVDAVRGVESQTQTVWRQADQWRCARLVFVNKMDRPGADFAATLRSLEDTFSCRPVPISIPLFDEAGAFVGLGEPIHGTVEWFAGAIPDLEQQLLKIQMDHARDRLVEACAESDDEILADFVAGRPVADDRLVRGMRRACGAGALVPVLAGAALLGRGVDLLLDAICDFLPSPRDRDRTGLEAAFPQADPMAPLLALVFKIEHEGDEVRSHLRVFRGVLRRGMPLQCVRSGSLVEVPELWVMHASSHESVEAAGPGEIVVIPRCSSLRTGDTVHQGPAGTLPLPMPEFPEPVVAAVFETVDLASRSRVERALAELLADDPTLRVGQDLESGLPLVTGMGELHLEIVAERVHERTGTRVRVGPPRVAQRVSVWREARGAATVVDHGLDATAHAEITIQPLQLLEGTEVHDELDGRGASRLEVRKLVADLAVEGGAFDSAPVGIRLTVHAAVGEGKGAGVALLQQALLIAMQKAVGGAGLRRLEPAVDVLVQCPVASTSVVLDDLALRGAAVRQVSSGQMGSKIQARGALRAFLGYATRLRSLTKGRGEAFLAPAGLVDCADDAEPAVPTQN